jgi:hypothetical protein
MNAWSSATIRLTSTTIESWGQGDPMPQEVFHIDDGASARARVVGPFGAAFADGR